MGRRSIVIFGPANGFNAFRLPGIEEVGDETLALSSSELAMADNAVALVCCRPPSSASSSPVLRVGIYKQVYEKTLRREGHSFGGALEFFDDLPEPKTILNVIKELLTFVENDCVSDHRFCGPTEFRRFLSNTLTKSMTLILKDLDPPSSPRPAAIEPGCSTRASYAHGMESSLFGSETERLLHWFGTDPGGTQCNRLVIYQTGTAVPGELLKPLPPQSRLLVDAYHQLQAELAKSRERETTARHAQLVASGERDQLRSENERLVQEQRDMKTRIYSEPPDSPKASRSLLSEHDLCRIREAFRDVARELAPRSRQREHAEERTRERPGEHERAWKLDLSLLALPDVYRLSMLVLVCLVLFVIVLGTLFLLS